MTIAEPEIQTPPAAAPAEPGPLHTRILETFVSPGELFARFQARAPWVDVLLISAVLAALMVVFIPTDVLVQQIREQAAKNPNTPSNFDPASYVWIGRITGLFGALIGTVVISVAFAGLYRLITGAMLGGEATFEQTLAVVAHAALIGAAGALLTLPVIILSGDATRQLTLALVAPGLDEAGVAYRFLSWLNVFTLWQLGVISVGLAAINRPKVKVTTAAAVVFGIYLAFAVAAAFIGASMAAR